MRARGAYRTPGCGCWQSKDAGGLWGCDRGVPSQRRVSEEAACYIWSVTATIWGSKQGTRFGRYQGNTCSLRGRRTEVGGTARAEGPEQKGARGGGPGSYERKGQCDRSTVSGRGVQDCVINAHEKYLLSTRYVRGTVPGSGDTVSKRRTNYSLTPKTIRVS